MRTAWHHGARALWDAPMLPEQQGGACAMQGVTFVACCCWCALPIAGAMTKRKLTAPSDVRDLYEPEPGTKGALPFKMAHTHRMK